VQRRTPLVGKIQPDKLELFRNKRLIETIFFAPLILIFLPSVNTIVAKEQKAEERENSFHKYNIEIINPFVPIL